MRKTDLRMYLQYLYIHQCWNGAFVVRDRSVCMYLWQLTGARAVQGFSGHQKLSAAHITN